MCSGSGRRARTSPSSPTSASTRSSTAARSRPASRSATAARSSSTRTWAWSRRSSTRPRWPRSRATSRSATAATPPPAPSVWKNAQPTFRPTADGSIALGHNGNLINTHELRPLVADLPSRRRRARHPLPRPRGRHQRHQPGHGAAGPPPRHVPGAARARRAAEAAGRVLLRLDGREHALRRARPARHPPARARPPRPRLGGRVRGRRAGHDRRQRRPRGRARRAARHRRERPALPQVRRAGPKGCVFEYVYLARPDATISGRSVHEARVEMGRRLAREFPVDADLVMPVPESGTPAAAGYAEESGIPFGQGFVKNAYVGRTFIQPSQTLRQLGIRLKLNAARPHDPRQEDRGGRRLDRARQHPARPGPDAARGRRAGGPRPDLAARR